MKRSITLTLLALAAACEGKKAATADTTVASAPAASAPAPAAPAAAVHIVSPAKGDSTGHDVKVVLAKENVTIAKADAQQVEGTGHYHLFLDTAPSPEGVAIPPTTKNVIHIGTGDSTYTFKGLAPGEHTIIAAIGYGNHVLMPSRRDTVKFIVKK